MRVSQSSLPLRKFGFRGEKASVVAMMPNGGCRLEVSVGGGRAMGVCLAVQWWWWW